MKIEEAIKRNEFDLTCLSPEYDSDRIDAIKLGIEALKAWREHRRIMGHPKLWVLPGETK